MEKELKRTLADNVFDMVNFVLVIIVVFTIAYPLYFVLIASMSDVSKLLMNPLTLLPRGFSLGAYKKVLENADIWLGFRNSVLYTVAGTLLNVIMTVLAAYPLSRRDFVGRNVFTFIFVFTMFFSGGMIPMYLVVKHLGLTDTFWALIIPGAVGVYNIVITRTYIQTSVPNELKEAVVIDGGNNLQLLLYVIIPLSAPILVVIGLFYAVGHWNSFFNALIYLSNRNLFPLQLILREILIFNEMTSMTEVATDAEYVRLMMEKEALKYAVVVVSSFPFILLLPYARKYFSKGMIIGSIKG